MSVQTKPDPSQTISSFQAWVLGARPKTLPAAAAPVLIGCAVAFAEGGFRWLPALITLLAALLLQIGANLANDYFDFIKGADQGERLGPTRVTQSGLLAPQTVRTGMWITFVLAAFCGIYLAWVSGWWIIVIGILAILAAIAYTGGPFPYGYKGLGEIFVFLFFGLAAVGGTYYAQTQTISWLAVLSSFPVGLMICAILVINNLRDLDNDRKSNKNTLAVKFGKHWTQQEFIAFLALAYLIVFLMGISALASPWILISWLSLPFIFPLSHSVIHDSGKKLNKTLAGMGQLTLLFSLLYSIGLILAVYFPIG
ncbi:MAG: 1,4-dihydroxy-2-naphthoate polyprenyltransferase [Anaerolineaceae bacterium]|nr:1,4-dihydroxy-2-naphthoate polyprenyltransferase [Anaerolineaceae bacterium]